MNLATKHAEDNVINTPCINIIQVAEQSPNKNSHQKSGKSAYFLARAKAKSYNICDDGTKTNYKEGMY